MMDEATTSESVTIDCDQCVMKASPVCGDCVVTYLCGNQQGEAVVIDVEEARALRVLGEAGLVPHLRLLPMVPQSKAG